MNNYLTFLVLLCSLNSFTIFGSIQPSSLSTEKLNLKKVLKENQLDNVSIRYALKNLDRPNEIYGNLQEEEFITASLTKIFTAVFSLKRLGADYQFHTALYHTGKIVNDTLKGDLYLVGSGDPSLTMGRLMDLCMDLRLKGIKKLEGSFFYDETIRPTILQLSSFGNGDQTYNPGLSALNLEYNRMTIYRDGAKKTKHANFVPLPPLVHTYIEKTKDKFSPGTRYRFKENKGGEVWEVSEHLKYNLYEDVPIRRPSRRTAEVFRNFSKLWGIYLPPARSGQTPREKTLISKDFGPPLLRLLASTLEYSNNLFAEEILMKAADKKTIPEAAQVLTNWLNKRIPSCKTPLKNGSGLTSENRLSSKCFVDFLEKFALSPIANRGFMSLLSIGGHNGWLKRRLRHPDTRFKVWAKTGSLDYVSNIAGVLFTASGNRFAFSLSFSDDQKRALIDKASEIKKEKKKALSYESKVLNQAFLLKKDAKAWGQRAKNAIDTLLKSFIQNL